MPTASTSNLNNLNLTLPTSASQQNGAGDDDMSIDYQVDSTAIAKAVNAAMTSATATDQAYARQQQEMETLDEDDDDDEDRPKRRQRQQIYTPDGYRFCTGCRANKKPEDFIEGRKMCYRHKKSKYTEVPIPTLLPYDSLVTLIQTQGSLTSGPSKFDAAISLTSLPGQDEVVAELRGPEAEKIELEDGVGKEQLLKIPEMKMIDDPIESMRRARARCRPLINLIHDLTGYVFVYKDCRSGRRLKYSHSLRYFCSQRGDQAETKRRSAAANAERRKAEEEQAKLAGEGLGLGTDTDITAATIAAIVQAHKHGFADDDGNENPLAGLGGGLDITAAMAAAAAAAVKANAAAAENEEGGNDIETGVGGGSVNGDDAGESHPIPGEMKPYKGKGKGWRKGTGKRTTPKETIQRRVFDPTKPRAPIRKMERYDCKGCLVINLFHDDDTAAFAYTHNIVHPEYVDVVGNRQRVPRFPSVPLAPPPPPTVINLETDLEDPVGPIDIDGDDGFEKAERTFQSMLDLVRLLRKQSGAEAGGGGEESAASKLYGATEEARKLRVSILEALKKSGKRSTKSAREKSTARKRKAEELDEEDEEEDEDDEEGDGADDDEDEEEEDTDDITTDLNGRTQTQEELDAQNINGVIAMYLKSASTAAAAGLNDDDDGTSWALDPDL